jgi:hypothetical protein
MLREPPPPDSPARRLGVLRFVVLLRYRAAVDLNDFYGTISADGKPTRRHISGPELATLLVVIPDLNEDGSPVMNPTTHQRSVTHRFYGACAHCNEPYATGAREPYHYVCMNVPSERDPRLQGAYVAPCHEYCAIDCGPVVEGYGRWSEE